MESIRKTEIGLDAGQLESKLHTRVLHSLEEIRIPGYEPPLIEKPKSRLDLPNKFFQEQRKSAAQRKLSLCYVDAVLHAQRVPRILIEVVDNNPTGPNGITGLTVNVDRVAEVHAKIDLLFVVLAEMKNFYCQHCNAGHQLANAKRRSCLRRILGPNPDERAFLALVHEGKAASFKKALVDYPIAAYLRNISPPSVVFLNAAKVRTAWNTYKPEGLRMIREEIDFLISSGDRSETRLIAVRELMPELTVVAGENVPNHNNRPPLRRSVTWQSPTGPQVDRKSVV